MMGLRIPARRGYGEGLRRRENPRALEIIGDALDVLGNHLEANHPCRRQAFAEIAQDNHHPFAVYFAQLHAPGDLSSLVFYEIGRIREPSRETIGDTQASI